MKSNQKSEHSSNNKEYNPKKISTLLSSTNASKAKTSSSTNSKNPWTGKMKQPSTSETMMCEEPTSPLSLTSSANKNLRPLKSHLIYVNRLSSWLLDFIK